MAKLIAAVAKLTQREVLVDKTSCAVIGVITFALLTGLGAYIRIPLPFTPVPLTLQTMFVLLAGAVLGGKKAAFSQIAAVVLGIAGITVFAGGTGVMALFGPTGGYLVGFILAAGFVGFLHRFIEEPSFLFTLWAMALGDMLLLGFGMVRLSAFVGGMQSAFVLGVLPFILGDFIKIILAALLYLPIASRSKEIFFS